MPQSDWYLVGASVQGTTHKKNAVPCQDAHQYTLLPNGPLIITVADGAGSAQQSAQGAAMAAVAAMNRMVGALQTQVRPMNIDWQELLSDAFDHARQALTNLAAEKEIALRAFATTLTCVVVAGDHLAIGQIGDGIIVLQQENGRLVAPLPPQRGEYANETVFLTTNHAPDQLQFEISTRPVKAVAVMTDGLMRLAMNLPEQTPHTPFFQPLLTFATQVTDNETAQAQLVSFLASERVCARTDDDKTLVLAVKHGE